MWKKLVSQYRKWTRVRTFIRCKNPTNYFNTLSNSATQNWCFAYLNTSTRTASLNTLLPILIHCSEPKPYLYTLPNYSLSYDVVELYRILIHCRTITFLKISPELNSISIHWRNYSLFKNMGGWKKAGSRAYTPCLNMEKIPPPSFPPDRLTLSLLRSFTRNNFVSKFIFVCLQQIFLIGFLCFLLQHFN